MNLRTANRRHRRNEARKSIFEWTTLRSNPFREYRRYRRGRPVRLYAKCRACNRTWQQDWIEKNGLCPHCY
jgi:hypothetical protein